MSKQIITKPTNQIQVPETVAEFLARGGKITYCEPQNARGAQKPQTIKKAKTYRTYKGR